MKAYNSEEWCFLQLLRHVPDCEQSLIFLSDGDFRDTRARFSYITLSFMYLHCLNISHWLLRFSFFCSISSESIPGKQVEIAVTVVPIFTDKKFAKFLNYEKLSCHHCL